MRNLSAYEALNARVVGVSRDDVITLKYWTKHLRITFPLLSNISGYVVNSTASMPFSRQMPRWHGTHKSQPNYFMAP